MKKTFIFALTLVASVLAFTSCNDKKKDEPDNNSDATIIDAGTILNTSWRTEGVYVNGKQQAAPHFYLQILGVPVGKAVVNNDTISYSIDGNKITCDEGKFEVLAYTGTTAKITDGTIEINLTKMPEWGEQFMEPKSADFVGTWKLAYYTMNSHSSDGSVWFNLGTNPGVETWELRADGTATYQSTFSGEKKNGSWSFEFGMLMVNNPAQSILKDENDRITVQPLTTNWMGFVRGIDGGGGSITYYQFFFVRVK